MSLPYHRLALVLTAALLGSGCATESISMNKQERYFARSQSELGRIQNYVERYSWAKEKSDEYREMVQESESELRELRVEIAQLRDVNKKRAKELQGLSKESDALAKSVATEKAKIASSKGALAKSQTEFAALQKQKAAAAAQTATLRKSLQKAMVANPKAKLRLERLLRDLGR
ncbi:MAG: hypothetical protein V3W41_10335 [Planctomycetota bacterium]